MMRRALVGLLGLQLALGQTGPAPLPVERYCEGHPVQESFLADGSRVVVLICGRRTGKTVVFAVKAVRGAQGGEPGQWVVYITRTRKNAKKQVWPWIKKILRESNIPHKVNESDLSVELEGGAGIMLGGEFTWYDYFMWNEIPTVIGNLVGGLTFVGAMIYATHYKTSQSRRPADSSAEGSHFATK